MSSLENTPKGLQDLAKFHFLHINKKVGKILIMNDLKWSMLSYYVIYLKISEKSCNKQRRKLYQIVVTWVLCDVSLDRLYTSLQVIYSVI